MTAGPQQELPSQKMHKTAVTIGFRSKSSA